MKLVECLEKFNKVKIDADTSFRTENQIFIDEFDDSEYFACAIVKFSELFSYFASGRINIRINQGYRGQDVVWVDMKL